MLSAVVLVDITELLSVMVLPLLITPVTSIPELVTLLALTLLPDTVMYRPGMTLLNRPSTVVLMVLKLPSKVTVVLLVVMVSTMINTLVLTGGTLPMRLA